MNLSAYLPRFTYYALLLSALGLTSACTTTIEIDDEEAHSMAGYIEKKVNDRVAFGASVVQIKGDAAQTLGDSGEFNINGQEIFGPADINHEFKLNTGRVYTNITLADNATIGVNLIAGLARTKLELTSIDINSPEDEILLDDMTTGLSFGAELTVPLNNLLAFKARGIGTNYYAGGDRDSATMIDLEAAMHFNIAKQMSVFAGIYSQNYRNDNSSSDIDINASGARAGIDLHF